MLRLARANRTCSGKEAPLHVWISERSNRVRVHLSNDFVRSFVGHKKPVPGNDVEARNTRPEARVAQGVKLRRPKTDSATEWKVRKQLAKGVGILTVAKSLGIGTGTVQRIADELR
jgi:hypothetical protein